MQLICKSKIGKKRSKPSITYPLIHLPKEFAEIIGRPVSIYATEREEGTVSVVAVEAEDNQAAGKVGQPCSEVGQLRPVSTIESRLSAIESQIAELKSLIFQDGSEADAKTENKRPRARFEPASWPPPGRCLYSPCKCAIKRLLISVAAQGKSGTLAFPGFITT